MLCLLEVGVFNLQHPKLQQASLEVTLNKELGAEPEHSWV